VNINFMNATAKRLQDFSPATYDKESRTIDAVLSRGSPVVRFYGTEVLEISRKAIDLSRMASSGVPVLDSHQNVGITNSLGKLTHAWIETDSIGPALMGTLRFHATPEGVRAEQMVARGEVGGISAGYSISEWKITDADGEEVDPRSTRWDEDNLTFTAVKWQLAECSLVSVPAEAEAGVRAAAAMRADRAYYMMSPEVRASITRARSRHAMMMRSGSTLYIEPDDIPRSSIFDALQRHPLSVRDIKARMQARHDIAFGPPT
jgi:phage head maturation protease